MKTSLRIASCRLLEKMKMEAKGHYFDGLLVFSLKNASTFCGKYIHTNYQKDKAPEESMSIEEKKHPANQ